MRSPFSAHFVTCLTLAAFTAHTIAQPATQPAAPASAVPATAADIPLITPLMLGTFSSLQQSKTDPSYRHILLHMSRIWPDRTDGIWIYVEQAVAPTAAQAGANPYRQRIYRLFQRDDGKLVSRVFTLPGDPLVYAGAWHTPALLKDLTPDQLDTRTGCDMLLTKVADDHFLGHTEGTGCQSKLNGSSYATSSAVIRPDGLHTWDQGFNDKGEQVWGATKGPYIFLRQPDDARP